MPIHVILADDSAPLQRLVRSALMGLDLNLSCVGEGAHLRELLRDEPPQLLLLDHALPGINWRDVLRGLGQDALRVWVMAGPMDGLDEGRVKREGARGLLMKPFDSRQLRALLGEMLPEVFAGRVVEESPPESGLNRVRRDLTPFAGGALATDERVLELVEARLTRLIHADGVHPQVEKLIRGVIREELARILPTITREEVRRRIAELESEVEGR